MNSSKFFRLIRYYFPLKYQWLAVFLIIILISPYLATAQRVDLLPRSVPEMEGVSSKGIEAFLDALSNSKGNELHSFMLVRHGKVIAEGNWLPYRSDYMHDVASISKSFTSTAIGFAVTSGLLKLEDRVATFFPNELPEIISDNLQNLTIKNLLAMSVGQETELRVVGIKNENWIKSFLAYPIRDKPGTKFLYNPMANNMLSAILQKVTGQTTLEYLNGKLFKDNWYSPSGLDRKSTRDYLRWLGNEA